jgi:hypothetical protein
MNNTDGKAIGLVVLKYRGGDDDSTYLWRI